MVHSGLDVFLSKIPPQLKNKRVGILCHAASVTSSYTHIIDELVHDSSVEIKAIFGPQHGLFGQTQDNMIQWEGYIHPVYEIKVYSLYGKERKPTPAMLQDIDAFIIDLQDVGARPYTYIWTIKLCMEACAALQIPIWILDRPNPIGAIPFDGPLLHEEYFSFVGGAQIPLCHRMTIGELSTLLKQCFYPSLDLHVVWMKNWWRDSMYYETGLPWVLPSPNMPSVHTAAVYPGMVLFEATNVSEGRGTTIPFELFGAPFIHMSQFAANLKQRVLPGCLFREHNFIPTFQKWHQQYCCGMQIHVRNPRVYKPVFTAASILEAIIQTTQNDAFSFIPPPYEYEYIKMPFDILAGDTELRTCLSSGESLIHLVQRWEAQHEEFRNVFVDSTYYPEKQL